MTNSPTNRTPAGSHCTRHLDCLQLSSAWKCWLPSQCFPLSAALQRVFITSASSEALTPMYLSHGVLEIAMTLSNAPECQAQFRKLDSTSLYHPSAPFPCCSLSLSAAPSREALAEIVHCSPPTSPSSTTILLCNNQQPSQLFQECIYLSVKWGYHLLILLDSSRFNVSSCSIMFKTHRKGVSIPLAPYACLYPLLHYHSADFPPA